MMTFANSMAIRFRSIAWIFLSALVFSGCETMDPAPPPPPPGLAPQATGPSESSPDLLRPGNKITITFSETSTPPPPHEETVREDGKITPPLIGSVMAAGKRAGQLQEELHDLYVPSFYKRLTVTVKTDARFFSVDGEIRTPSLQPYMGEMTLLKGIASAGGFTDFAKKSKVYVIRPGRDKPIIVDCEKAQKDPKLDIPIYPQDRIWVQRRYW